MGILSKLRERGVQARGKVTTLPLTDISALAHPTASGKNVTEEASLRISTAWCCMRIISESIGALPWHIYSRDDEGNAERADEHELAEILLRSPNADMTSVEFREAVALNLAMHGNAYSYIERSMNAQRVLALFPLRSRDCRPMRKLGNNTPLRIPEGAVFFRVSDRGQPEDLPREKIWHVKGFGNDGLIGLSPLGAAREAMGGALAAEEFANLFFAQGGMPSGTVSYPGWLTKEQRAVARDGLQALLGGLGAAHRFALFEGGVKPEAWNTLNMEDMQFIALRKFSVLEICRFFRIPPHLVADMDRATFSNIESQSQDFVQHALLPYLTRIEASVGKWLFSSRDRGQYFLRFNFEGLLRADSAGRAAFYASALQNGYMNRNEVRAKEKLNRVDGLDEFTCQTNLAPVEDIGELQQPQRAAEQRIVFMGGGEAGNALTQQLQELQRWARAPRKLVLDSKGEPVGSVPVERL